MNLGRSESMRRIRSKDTTPELIVRKLIRDLGYPGYRIHRKDLPGKPDVAFVGRKKAVMIDGCLWHGHTYKEGLRESKSNREYWLAKIEGNRSRDKRHLSELKSTESEVLTVWECELRDREALKQKLTLLLASKLPAKLSPENVIVESNHGSE